jgi:hypothetical protein
MALQFTKRTKKPDAIARLLGPVGQAIGGIASLIPGVGAAVGPAISGLSTAGGAAAQLADAGSQGSSAPQKLKDDQGQAGAIARAAAAPSEPDRLGTIKEGILASRELPEEARREVAQPLAQGFLEELQKQRRGGGGFV